MKQSVVDRKVVAVVDASEVVGIAVSDKLNAISTKMNCQYLAAKSVLYFSRKERKLTV